MKSQNSPESIPSSYAHSEKLTDAYQRGWAHGHGVACCNVPHIGDRIDRSVDYVGCGKFVDADNIREYHEILTRAGADGSRDYSPFEFTAHEFNSADDEPETVEAMFNRFTLDLPFALVGDCSHQGQCDDDCTAWAKRFPRPDEISVDEIRAELKETGAWSEEELSDNDANWKRLLWIAASNVKEERAGLPNSEELWAAFEEGTNDAISADLATYEDSDYGINE